MRVMRVSGISRLGEGEGDDWMGWTEVWFNTWKMYLSNGWYLIWKEFIFAQVDDLCREWANIYFKSSIKFYKKSINTWIGEHRTDWESKIWANESSRASTKMQNRHLLLSIESERIAFFSIRKSLLTVTINDKSFTKKRGFLSFSLLNTSVSK